MGLFNKRRKNLASSQSGTVSETSNKSGMQRQFYNLQDITAMSIGGNCCIAPVDAGFLFDNNASSCLSIMGNTPRIRKYLPNIDISSEDAAKKYIQKEVLRAESGLGFSYFIMMGQNPVGMIIVNTPAYNESLIGFPHWTLYFFVFEIFEGKGFIRAALPRVLFTLKEKIHLDEVYTIIDPDNKRGLSLMNYFPFTEVSYSLHNAQDQMLSLSPRVFCCKLSMISFQRR